MGGVIAAGSWWRYFAVVVMRVAQVVKAGVVEASGVEHLVPAAA
jgi:hypothetical protein